MSPTAAEIMKDKNIGEYVEVFFPPNTAPEPYVSATRGYLEKDFRGNIFLALAVMGKAREVMARYQFGKLVHDADYFLEVKRKG